MRRHLIKGFAAASLTGALLLGAPSASVAKKGGVPNSSKPCPTHKHHGKHNGAKHGKKNGAGKGKKCGHK
jgi:hypothetical protein